MNHVISRLIALCFVVTFTHSLEEMKNKMITLRMGQAFQNYFVVFQVGTPSQGLIFPLSLDTSYSWKNTIFECSSSSTCIMKGVSFFLFHEKEREAIAISDKLQLAQDDPLYTDFNFLIVNRTNCPSSNSVGEFSLAYKYSDLAYSLIDQLKNQDLISKRAFSIDNFSSYLYFGDLPTEKTINKFKGQCRVTRHQSKWACSLRQVAVGNATYVNKHYAYFQAQGHIYVPHDFIDFLNRTVFEPLRDSRTQCDQMRRNDDKLVSCVGLDRTALPIIEIVFDGNFFRFNLSDFFEPNGSHLEFLLVEDIGKGKDEWVFGMPFLNRFISVFDYEENSITFYGDTFIGKTQIERITEKEETVVDDRRRAVRLLEIILGAFLIASVGFGLFIKFFLGKTLLKHDALY